MEGLKKPLIIILGLLVAGILLFVGGNSIESFFPSQNPAEIAAMPLGETVVSGTDVVNDLQVRKTATIYHPEYILEFMIEGKVINLLNAVLTGTTDPPIKELASNTISKYGVATGFEGPGFLTVTDNKLTVQPPGTFVWGFMTPYTVGVKKKDGLEIEENGKSTKFVAAGDINNNTVPHDYVNVTELKKWYNKSKEGDKISLIFSLSKFSDGRNTVPPSKIETFFGKQTAEYMKMYPNGTPIMVYNNAKKEEVVSSSVSIEESYPEYNDYIRCQNAQSFVLGWNNTIIPAHTASHGKKNATFEGVYDKKEGYVSHRVCPPGRALRDAVMQVGFPLPIGMTSGYFSISSDSNPTTDVMVNNTGDYPVKIIMWTEGSGPSMRLYAKVIRLLP
jgi:hypothetical protein